MVANEAGRRVNRDVSSATDVDFVINGRASLKTRRETQQVHTHSELKHGSATTVTERPLVQQWDLLDAGART